MINPSLTQRAGELADRFATAQPFRYVVIDSFLEPDACERLNQEFPPFEAGRATNELGKTGGKAVRSDLARISAVYEGFDRMIQTPAFLKLISAITGIPKLLYDPDYAGGGTHENRHGQDLDTHVDFNYHPRTHWHRRLNLILFLNREWQPEWGGLLDLGNPVAETVLPLFNRCVIFETTESSWHGFRRIDLPDDRRELSRRSVAIYFYTRSREKACTAPSNGTIYVPRPMPEFVEAGHVLTDADVYELAVHFARRDEQIRYLYERELEFSRIAHSPSFRLARALMWPLRMIRKL
jgi:hypothetical protein